MTGETSKMSEISLRAVNESLIRSINGEIDISFCNRSICAQSVYSGNWIKYRRFPSFKFDPYQFREYEFIWKKNKSMDWLIDGNHIWNQSLQIFFNLSESVQYEKKGQPFDRNFKLFFKSDVEFVIDYVKVYEWVDEYEIISTRSSTTSMTSQATSKRA
jgi:hypothetical protein